MAETIKIAGELESVATGNKVADVANIKDKTKGNKSQAEINAENDATLANHTTAINGLNSQNYVTVTATDQTTAETDVLPDEGSVDTIYRVGNWDGTQFDETCYSEYAWNGSVYVHLSTKTQVGEVFDISAYHATGGTLAEYDDLSDALGVEGANIPESLRKGGMSVKFIQGTVQSSDNKYIQARCMAQNFTTDVTQWQGVDDEPTAGSENLVKSGGVSKHVTYNRYLIDGTIQVFPGYVSGSVGNNYNIIPSSTRHYCIVPANPGLSQVILKGCTSYQRWDIDASKNIISYGQAVNAVPSNAKFLAFNFEDADNTYSGATILQNLSVAEQERFGSHDYNCFIRYSTNQDKEYSTSNSNGILYSQFYRSIIDIKLKGFNKGNPHHLYNLTRDYGSTHKYGIIIRELINGTWTIVFNSSKTNVETDGVQNGVNVVTWTSGTKSVTATIDYSFVTANIDKNLAYTPYIFKKECFEDFDALDTQVQTLQSSAILKSMLGYSVVSDNIANPEDIQTDMYVRSDGVVAPQDGWAVASAAVIAGQKVTFGGFKLGRSGYYRFQDANGNKVSYGIYTDPNGRSNPITLDVPDTAVLLFIDIASTESPSDPYSGLQINLGDTFLPYDEYKNAITSINNEPLAGGASKELEGRVEDLENSVVELQEEISVGLANIIADLPVSDGTDIEVGYAYIDSSTSVVKIKLS